MDSFEQFNIAEQDDDSDVVVDDELHVDGELTLACLFSMFLLVDEACGLLVGVRSGSQLVLPADTLLFTLPVSSVVVLEEVRSSSSVSSSE